MLHELTVSFHPIVILIYVVAIAVCYLYLNYRDRRELV